MNAVQQTSIKRQAAQARFEALVARVQEFLALHGYAGPVTPGTFEHVRNCERCGRNFEIVSVPFDGNEGLRVFWAEEDRRWRVEVRRANDRHHRFDVRFGEYCPVLAFALADLSKETISV